MSRYLWGVLLTLIVLLLALAAISPATPVAQAAPAASGLDSGTCTNLLINSGMESNTGWQFGNSPVPARYATERHTNGYRSMLLGISSAPNQHSYSSIKQFVTVPAGSSLRLRARVYPLSQPYDGHDAQELIIMNSTGQPLRRVWTSISNAQAWQSLEFDISEFTDMGIGIYFNVYNDGIGGVSAMYIDDVVLELCQGGSPTPVTATPTVTPIIHTATPTATAIVPTATPTPTAIIHTATPTAPPTATPTPTAIIHTVTPTPTATAIIITVTPTATPTTAASATPTATPVVTVTPTPNNMVCQNILQNGDFEQNSSWMFGDTKLHGRYVNNPVHHGTRSVLLGNPDASTPNIYSFSSISQRVTLPAAGASYATLDFWYQPVSGLEHGDTQEVVLLDAHDGSTLKVLWRVNENSSQWQHKPLDLTPYLGQDVIVYFNVFNNGGAARAKMFVDDVTLQLCGPPATAVPPTATPLPLIVATTAPTAIFATLTPTSPTQTPTTTPLPSVTAAAMQSSPTPGNQVTLPPATGAASDSQQKQGIFGPTVFKILSMALILFIIALIIIIAIAMIAQANKRNNNP